MISRNGICYDLELSEYKHTENKVTFVFSSQLHLDKFKNKINENRDIIRYSLSRRFNILVDIPLLADLVLYRKIETRGFLVINEEGQKICQREKIKFVGGRVTETN